MIVDVSNIPTCNIKNLRVKKILYDRKKSFTNSEWHETKIKTKRFSLFFLRTVPKNIKQYNIHCTITYNNLFKLGNIVMF
jgi:hypothetical protein